MQQSTASEKPSASDEAALRLFMRWVASRFQTVV